MQALRDQAARRAWTDVTSRVANLGAPEVGPSMGEVFRSAFMNASMLQLAVCAPGRRARTTQASEVLIARIGRKVEAKAEPAVAVPA